MNYTTEELGYGRSIRTYENGTCAFITEREDGVSLIDIFEQRGHRDMHPPSNKTGRVSVTRDRSWDAAKNSKSFVVEVRGSSWSTGSMQEMATFMRLLAVANTLAVELGAPVE